jgi:hypothetical protein
MVCAERYGQRYVQGVVAFRLKEASVCSQVMSDDTAYEDAKAEYEYWLELMTGVKEEGLKEFRFTYKKGREPDVLAYLLLNEEEKKLIRN